MMLLDYYGLNEQPIRRDALTLDTCFLAEVIAKRSLPSIMDRGTSWFYSALVAKPAWARQLFSSGCSNRFKNLQDSFFIQAGQDSRDFLTVWFGILELPRNRPTFLRCTTAEHDAGKGDGGKSARGGCDR